jgi:uncharacterized protein YecE (DUF72 family)
MARPNPHTSSELRSTEAFFHVINDHRWLAASVYVYVNNHYSGHAPATVAQFLKLWDKRE